MYKGIVSKEELAELLAEREDPERLLEEAQQGSDAEAAVQQSLVIQYLQDSVQQLMREVSELRLRIATLEGVRDKQPSAGGQTSAAHLAATEVLRTDADSGTVLSRVERYRSKRKWF